MRYRRMIGWLLVALCALVIAACAATTAGAPSQGVVPPVTGRVLFPGTAPVSPYTIQATISDIASASTISLIDTVANTTRGTTLTNSNGGFSLTFTNGFRPVAGQTYYLEAFRGLYNNVAGKNAARLRTLLTYQSGGWTSLCSSIPNNPVYIDEGTTALSVITSLEGPTGVNPSTLTGTLTIGTDTYAQPASTPTVQSGDYASVRPMVISLLTADSDPIAGIGYSGGAFFMRSSGSAAVSASPASASVGDVITVSGAAFDPTLPLSSSNVVLFNNSATGSVTSISSDRQSITVVVPTGATTGPLTIRTGGQIYGIPAYTVWGTLNVGLY